MQIQTKFSNFFCFTLLNTYPRFVLLYILTYSFIYNLNPKSIYQNISFFSPIMYYDDLIMISYKNYTKNKAEK